MPFDVNKIPVANKSNKYDSFHVVQAICFLGLTCMCIKTSPCLKNKNSMDNFSHKVRLCLMCLTATHEGYFLSSLPHEQSRKQLENHWQACGGGGGGRERFPAHQNPLPPPPPPSPLGVGSSAESSTQSPSVEHNIAPAIIVEWFPRWRTECLQPGKLSFSYFRFH